jgi:zeaxanthin glucosyltransferase
MVRVGILALSQPGHINATVRLRNELLELDCDVRYIVDKFQHGEEDLYTKRSLPVTRAFPTQSGSLHIPGFSPDVILIESVLIIEAIKFWDLGIPVVKLCSTFSQRYDPRLPPVTSNLPPSAGPDQSGEHAERVASAWNVEHARANPWQPQTWLQECVDFARSRGFPRAWIDERAAIDITFRFPELSLAPSELDFERTDEDLFYAGPCVDLSRDETPMTGLPTDRPVVYCAFGTQTHRYPDLKRRAAQLLDAARMLPDLHFVLSWDGEELENVPPNVVATQYAPQLSLLRRSALFVTHGGLNSLKEALCLGVPPLVLPFDADQPGNAARLMHHGCGRYASWDLEAVELADLVRHTLNDQQLRRRVLAISERLLQALDEKSAAKAFQRAWEYSRRFRKRRASRSVWVMV